MNIHVSAIQILSNTYNNMLLKIYISFVSSANVGRASTNLKYLSNQTRISGIIIIINPYC